MAPEPAGHRVRAEFTEEAFGVKRVIFSVGAMSGTARRLLRKRLGSELDAVRDLIRKAEFFLGAGPAGESGGADLGDDGRLSAAEPHPEALMEVDGTSEAKRRKVSPSVQRTEEQKRMTPDERGRLAERLASLAAALPDHVVVFLQNQCAGDADYRGDGSETETDMQSMKDGALFQLKLLLDKFAPASPPKNQGRAAPDASGVSCLSQHHRQDASDKTSALEREGNVGICGGASRRVQLRDIAEEYGELVGAIGVLLLSPLQRKHVDLAEHDEYVDICGDASPVVFPAAKASVISSSSPSSSCSGSGASSSDSDDTSSSDSDTGSDSDENVSRPPPPPDFREEDNTTSEEAAQPPKPAPGKVQIVEPEEIQQQCASPTPAVPPITSSPPAPLVLPKESGISTRLPEAALEEAVQIAKAEDLYAAPAVRPIIGSSPTPLALPKGNDTSAQPPESVPNAVHKAEPEELQYQRAEVTAPTEPPINSNPPAPPKPLPNENDTSAQPPPPAPDAAHVVIAEPEEYQDRSAAADDPLTNLIAKAQEAIERRRQEERNRAREKARRELVEVERAALPNERIHPLDMELLGIAAFEHIVSTVEGARTALPTRENGRVAPGCPTVMQFLGLFLKVDDGREEQEPPPGVAPGGADMDVEEGEIR